MMKKIFGQITMGALSLLAAACGESFLDRDPGDALPSSDAVANYADAVTALNGVYDGLQSHYGAQMIYIGDVLGDDMQSGTGNRSGICYEMRYTLSDAPAIWSVPYDVIRRANNVIKAIEAGKVTDGEPVAVDDILGQALAVRALVHFDLVRLYGLPYAVNNGASLGVPVVTKPEDASYLPARSTVEQVYTQIIEDLNHAIPKLEEGKKTGYINQWAAKALLSKVYLYQGDNTKALALAENVMEKAVDYALWQNSEYVDAWSLGGNSELLFEVVNQNTTDFFFNDALGYLLNETGYADIILTKSFLEMMQQDPADVRLKLFLPAKLPDFVKRYGTMPVFLNKYPGRADFQPTDVRVNNIPVIRLSDVCLMAAEAAAKKTDAARAAFYLNKIVQRANPEAPAVPDAHATLDRILLERRKELVGEGQRFFDLMRNQRKVVRYTSPDDQGFHYPLELESQQFDVTYFRVLLPIPKKEMDANKHLVKEQNPGY